MRLDEILVRDRLVTKNHVREGLDYQKRHGGRLETHLFRFGYIDEVRLAKALTDQFGYEAACLSNSQIPESIVAMIPAHLAFEKVLMPFDYDAETNTLKVACENPRNHKLADELAAVAGDKKVKLFVAVGDIIRCAIIKHYRNSTISTAVEDLMDGNPTQEEPSSVASIVHGSGMPAHGGRYYDRVLLLNDDHKDLRFLKQALGYQGFDVAVTESIECFSKIFRQSWPDILLLLKSGPAEEMSVFLDNLAAQQISVHKVPTFLIPEPVYANELIGLLKRGIEDVIPIDDSADILIVKMARIRNRLETAARQRRSVIEDLGTHGSLEDMNVIDLLQAMGPSEKTARISITASRKQLTIFLNRGNIIYAECDGISGADAIYQGIPWKRGIWSIDPVSPNSLPEPNNYRSNDSILLEGCCLLDENSQASAEGDMTSTGSAATMLSEP